MSRTARILINSQAPGTKAHLSGIPFNDASGERLREWLQIGPETFYDASRIAVVPTGLCYPGMLPNGGDAPPRPECAPLWLNRFIELMPDVRLTLLVGGYAIKNRLGKGTMTEHVRCFRALGPAIIPLPHPSWRTKVWEKRNPWFEEQLLPEPRRAVATALGPRAR
ncbi:MAG TPA: uracil-DNA glycosylase family protein [Rhodopila sp.]|nr:uracil-DNA glycosylase family protein [Rhodopila sp.]